MEFVNVNGAIVKKDEAFINISDRSYRYGDGLFETMKVFGGIILLKNLHFERLFGGLTILKYRLDFFPAAGDLEKEVSDLCKKNNCLQFARVRLSVSGGNGGLYNGDENLQYL